MQREPGNGRPHAGDIVSVEQYFQTLGRLIPRLPYAAIGQIVSILLQVHAEDRTVYLFGNGGSAATASHSMCDLSKGTADGVCGRRLKVIALTDNVPLLTAWANDASYEHVFSEQLRTFVQPRDAAFAISTSGDSLNVLLALATAREAGAITLGITGHQGGKMKPLCDVCAVVPCDCMQIIEDVHHAMAHAIFAMVWQELRSREQAAVAASVGGIRP
ncbi:MAG TPA: SIS domain-containing protein [Terriglobales bacterium]|jgi:D-sedoheptulose 7-phosphate isomerase|nr:SIS domain-containing protein [Terriglobales bacterium]